MGSNFIISCSIIYAIKRENWKINECSWLCLIEPKWNEYNIHQLIFIYCSFQCFSAGWRKWIASFSPINQPGNWCLNWWLGYTVNWAPSLWTVIVHSFQTHCPANEHRIYGETRQRHNKPIHGLLIYSRDK